MITLFAHQLKAVEKARTQPNLALFFDAGTGKTATMITILNEDYQPDLWETPRLKSTLIFAPISVCPQWKREFARFSAIPQESILVLTGPGHKRTKELAAQLATGKPCIVVTNYEAVQIKAFYDLLLKFSPEIVVLDESHRIKDSRSKRARRIYPLTSAARRKFLLTGTPVVNSLLDIFGQYKALDEMVFGRSLVEFREKFFVDKNYGQLFSYPDWVARPWASEEIGKLIASTSVQAKRDECLALPPLQQIAVPVELSSAQKKAYKEMQKDFMTEVSGMVSSVEFQMVKTLRMQQILAGFIQPDEKEEAHFFKDQPRLDTLCDLIDSIGKEQFIVWTTFRPTYAKIGEALEKRKIKIGFITGEQSAGEKQDVIAAFKRGELQGVIANPAAAAEGINLQEARYAFYYLRGYHLLHFMQSFARNYRSGSESLHKSVCHYHLFAKGTLDEVIAYALLNKEDVGNTVLKWARGQFSLDSVKCNIVEA